MCAGQPPDHCRTFAAHAHNVTKAAQPDLPDRPITMRLCYGQEHRNPVGHNYGQAEGHQLGFYMHPTNASWKDTASWASEIAQCTRAAWLIWHCECVNKHTQRPRPKGGCMAP